MFSLHLLIILSIHLWFSFFNFNYVYLSHFCAVHMNRACHRACVCRSVPVYVLGLVLYSRLWVPETELRSSDSATSTLLAPKSHLVSYSSILKVCSCHMTHRVPQQSSPAPIFTSVRPTVKFLFLSFCSVLDSRSTHSHAC